MWKLKVFPICKGINDLNLISLLKESFKMLEFNLEFPDPKRSNEIWIVFYYEICFFQDFYYEKDFDRVTKWVFRILSKGLAQLSSCRANSRKRLYSNNSDVVDIECSC